MDHPAEVVAPSAPARPFGGLECDALLRLHELNGRLSLIGDVPTAAREILDALIESLKADCGTVQLHDASVDGLRFVAQRGLDQIALDSVGVICGDFHSTCARALTSGKRIIVEDFETDPDAAAHRATAHALGYRAAQSTPLRGAGGGILGMITTHFRAPRRLSAEELRIIDLFANEAAHLLQRARADAALREAARRKDEFLAVLAHELRNPLAPIRQAIGIVRSGRATGEQIRLSHEVIERQTAHMSLLLDDLLDVSRIARGQLSLHLQRIELAAVIESAIETARPAIDSKGHHLTVDAPLGPVHARVDPLRVAQILANLLTNAAKYSQQGAEIRLTVATEDCDVLIRVRDSGIGIAPEMLGSVFEMYRQVEASSPDRTGNGLGIGLALAKGLAELHGGSIEARSEGLGRGSEFIVRMPGVEPPRRCELWHSESLQGAHVQPRRILVADDNQDAAETLQILLALDGHEVHAVHDGEAAVREAEIVRPDVMLVDIGMPRLNGYDVARSIRAQRWGQRIKLIAITGWGQASDRQRSAEAGFDQHLTKPVEHASVRRLLAEE